MGGLLFVEFVLQIFVFRHSQRIPCTFWSRVPAKLQYNHQRIQCTFWSRMPGKLQYNHYLGHSGSIIAETLVCVFYLLYKKT